jgi:hypothetical protein|tara:strand:+ start:65 stop:472 length:408 start_codon:yes stop_codon:yes gene_type:complete
MYSLKHIFSNAILILLLTTISSHAVAEWINISANSNVSTIYVDPATIQKSDARTKMWILFDYRKAIIESGDKIMSIKKREEYDCNKSQARLLYISKHSGRFTEGKAVYVNDIPYNEWIPVIPSSISEDLWRYACS